MSATRLNLTASPRPEHEGYLTAALSLIDEDVPDATVVVVEDDDLITIALVDVETPGSRVDVEHIAECYEVRVEEVR